MITGVVHERMVFPYGNTVLLIQGAVSERMAFPYGSIVAGTCKTNTAAACIAFCMSSHVLVWA